MNLVFHNLGALPDKINLIFHTGTDGLEGHVPEKLPSMVAVLSPPSNTSRESQFCSVTKLITWICTEKQEKGRKKKNKINSTVPEIMVINQMNSN